MSLSDLWCVSGGGCRLPGSSFTGVDYKTDGQARAEKWGHTLWWLAGGWGETTWRRIQTLEQRIKGLIHHPSFYFSFPLNRSSSGRGSTLFSWRFTQPRSSRMLMTPSSLRSASVTMETSSTTPASLWPLPPSSAGLCLTVGQRLQLIHLNYWNLWCSDGVNWDSLIYAWNNLLHSVFILCVFQVATTTTSHGEMLNRWWSCLQSGRISNQGLRL